MESALIIAAFGFFALLISLGLSVLLRNQAPQQSLAEQMGWNAEETKFTSVVSSEGVGGDEYEEFLRRNPAVAEQLERELGDRLAVIKKARSSRSSK